MVSTHLWAGSTRPAKVRLLSPVEGKPKYISQFHSLPFKLSNPYMGKRRKQSSEPEELEELRSEMEHKPRKKKEKRKRDQQLDSSQEVEQPEDQEKQREKKRKTKNGSSHEEVKFNYLPGQVHETPKNRDPFRVFLESLYQQLPEDELVRRWMMEWGLLPREEATKALEKVNEKEVLSDGVGKTKTKSKKKKVHL